METTGTSPEQRMSHGESVTREHSTAIIQTSSPCHRVQRRRLGSPTHSGCSLNRVSAVHFLESHLGRTIISRLVSTQEAGRLASSMAHGNRQAPQQLSTHGCISHYLGTG